jgi:hypothetical protein
MPLRHTNGEEKLHTFTTSPLDGGDRSASHFMRKEPPVYLGQRAGKCGKEKHFCPCKELNSGHATGSHSVYQLAILTY